jgi:hypothetical protein
LPAACRPRALGLPRPRIPRRTDLHPASLSGGFVARPCRPACINYFRCRGLLTVVIAPTARPVSRDDAPSQSSLFLRKSLLLFISVQPSNTTANLQTSKTKVSSTFHSCKSTAYARAPTGATHLLPISRAPRHVLGCWGPFALARDPCVASTSSPTACNLQSAIHNPRSITPFFSSSSKLHSASSGTSPRQLATPNRMVCSAHPTPKATLAGDQRIIGPRHGTGGLDLPQSVSP